MEHFDEHSTETSERRKDDRAATRGRVRVELRVQALSGVAQNVSRSGVLFLSEDTLDVVVELESQGKVERRTGRLARAQRMSANTIGWAIEFDEPRDR